VLQLIRAAAKPKKSQFDVMRLSKADKMAVVGLHTGRISYPGPLVAWLVLYSSRYSPSLSLNSTDTEESYSNKWKDNI